MIVDVGRNKRVNMKDLNANSVMLLFRIACLYLLLESLCGLLSGIGMLISTACTLGSATKWEIIIPIFVPCFTGLIHLAVIAVVIIYSKKIIGVVTWDIEKSKE